MHPCKLPERQRKLQPGRPIDNYGCYCWFCLTSINLQKKISLKSYFNFLTQKAVNLHSV